ncbi:BZ3500_MvSof-1268-A1-R1_Chr4-2g07209 [Microbotryum saponariae]|uniref:Calcium-transporting ATPase n=1 Tax=Microbotryum saponariae TaxID=289078 RepID=A0A2X0MT27_9BASI|nr:BZ3500_MvSof-1268-A1-R1_Chr4-2g07209 [Microbotryum saponariae]SDA06874.1 BZ3501_MvSof-1269-A2-R1_Chr4-2g06920 [Microbotryum saponariae]
MAPAYALPPQQVLQQYDITAASGLSSQQVLQNRKLFGENVLPQEDPTPLWELILEQFKDQLVLILLASAAVSFVLAYFEESDDKATAYVEPIVILLILIANAVVGVVQETNAEKAIEALMKYSPDEAKVLRDGRSLKVMASELVPGDLISVAVGDKIPADARVISIASASFTMDQALLTGESHSVSKSLEVVKDLDAVKQDQINILFSGTTVVSGKATAVVIATGSNTAIGNIHTSITEQIAAKTPLKQKVDDFGNLLAKVISVICLLVWLVNIRNFSDPSHGGLAKGAIYYFKASVASGLRLHAIPEGLPVVITTCLALGTKKMAKKNAIVRSLPSVETLGCTNVICADKTGTLTTNQMSVCKVLVLDAGAAKELSVEGSTFAPVGNVSTDDGATVTLESLKTSSLTRLAEISALCSDAKVAYNESDLEAHRSLSQDTKVHSGVGEPTETSLKVLVEKLQSPSRDFNATLASLPPIKRATAVNEYYESQFERLLTFEFSRDRKSMSVLVRHRSASTAALYVKGAPESVFERCSYIHSNTDGARQPMSSSLRAELSAKVEAYGALGLRTLALAMIDGVDTDTANYHTESSADYVKFEQNMTFVGLVGMLDPPRPEVRGAIAKCRSAGIRVIVITGDNKNTAETICRQIGVFRSDENLHGKSYTGKEFDALAEDEQIQAVLNASLFSRTEPGHKLKIVELLQAQGLVCAMTGDGVNDAPALRRAAIGIAMGSGTDVAKLASDMVLADDNFASIESAIEEGRAIYENTKQFIRYLISSNIGEVVRYDNAIQLLLPIFLTVLLGMPEALIPVQLLWVNLVTDGLPATALGFNPPDSNIMRRPPRSSREPLVNGSLFLRYMVVGSYVGAATVYGYAWWFMYYSGGPQITFKQLTNFHSCSELFPQIGCDMFVNEMSKRATTVSLSILVVIEMFNAINSLAENESILSMPPWRNMYLVVAIFISMSLHFMILYVPFFSTLFVITPLNWDEWKAVLAISFPVILIDEAFKAASSWSTLPATKTKTA